MLRFRGINVASDPALPWFEKPIACDADFAIPDGHVKHAGMRLSRIQIHGWDLSYNRKIDDRMIERFLGRPFVANAPFCKNISPLLPRLGTAPSTVVQ